MRKERNDEMNEIFDKEEWASRKQQDREAAYAMVDDTLKKMGTNGKAFQTYLDVQSKFERYSVSNALLVAAQKPEATDLGDANFWRGRGGYIRKGESGILLMEPGNSYTRKDGSKGVNIHIKRVFDISQTTLAPTKQPAVSQDTRLLLNAMVRYAPYTTNFQTAGRELMTPDEVRMLDNRYALLFIRGERPVKDLKYNILKHPNVALTTDGKAVAYQHGTDPLSVAAVSINLEKLKQAVLEDTDTGDYVVLTEEEVYDFMRKKAQENNQNQNSNYQEVTYEKHYPQHHSSHHPSDF